LIAYYESLHQQAVTDGTSLNESIRDNAPAKLARTATRLREFYENTGPQRDRSIFLLETEVQYLAAEWAGDPNGSLTSIDTLDGSLHDICADVHSLATTGVLSSSMLNARAPGLRIRVCNTCRSGDSGTHWFTVVYHMQAFPRAAQRLNLDDCMLFVQRAVEDCIALRSHSTREIECYEFKATISSLLVEHGFVGLKDTEFVEVSEHLISLVRHQNSFPNWMLDSSTLNMHAL
jgi:hypothetical protein